MKGPEMKTFRLILIVALAAMSLCTVSMSAADNYQRGGQSRGYSRSEGYSRNYSQDRGHYRGYSRRGSSHSGYYRDRSSHSGYYRDRRHYGGYYRDRGYYSDYYGSPFWGSSWYYPYSYPFYYPYSPYYYPNAVVTVPSMPQEYIEQGPDEPAAPSTSDVWYYCPRSKAYYPYIKECRGGWQTVPVVPPPDLLQPPDLQRPAANIIDKMTLRVNFDFDRAIIRPGDKAVLDEMVAFVRKYPDAKIELDGYTDNSGTEAYNQRLSEKRAEAVKNYLIKEAGVGRSQISAVGRGESDPVADNKTAEGRFENRRVEILILGD